MGEHRPKVIDMTQVARLRWRWILLLTMLGIAVGGLLIVLPPHYRFRTVLEVGRMSDAPIDSNETVVSKLNDAYLPLATNDFLPRTKDRPLPKIEARSPQNSVLLVLSSDGPESDEALHIGFHQALVDRLLADHLRSFDKASGGLRDAIVRTRAHLEILRSEERRIAAAIAFEVARPADPRLAENNVGPRSPGATVADDSPIVVDGGTAMSFRSYRQPEQALVDTLKLSANAEETLLNQERAFSLFRETRVILGPIRSAVPVGIQNPLKLGIGAFIGFVIGLLMAYLLEVVRLSRRVEGP